jgi:RNA polymerase sigma factor (sigma-70 family)
VGVSDEDQRSDAELLVAARESAAPFGTFYERHFASVLAFFRRRTAGPEEAFDLAAETFAAALSAVPRYAPGPEPAAAWLFAIARNTLRESIRKGRVQDQARRALSMEPVVLDDEAVALVEEMASGPVLELLAGLPTDQRRAVEARYLNEREYSDIARDLRCSESVIRKRASRGLATLRAHVLKEETS